MAHFAQNTSEQLKGHKSEKTKTCKAPGKNLSIFSQSLQVAHSYYLVFTFWYNTSR